MPKSKGEVKTRGIFQRPPESGIWWISYMDASVRRREKVGRKSDALALHRKRRSDIRSGIKLPENLRATCPMFGEIADAALLYSSTHHNDNRNFRQRTAILKRSFGSVKADRLKPKDIEEWLNENTKTTPTANRYKPSSP